MFATNISIRNTIEPKNVKFVEPSGCDKPVWCFELAEYTPDIWGSNICDIAKVRGSYSANSSTMDFFLASLLAV
jgi:hypothetical protein